MYERKKEIRIGAMYPWNDVSKSCEEERVGEDQGAVREWSLIIYLGFNY